MDLAYVCEWEKRPKSDHCPPIPLVCAWSCRNLIAFTTDLRNEEERGAAHPHPPPPLTHSPRCSRGPSAFPLPPPRPANGAGVRLSLRADLTHMVHIIDTEHPWDVYSVNSGHVEAITCLEWDQSGEPEASSSSTASQSALGWKGP